MQGQEYSYLDLSVHKKLRRYVLSQDAVVVFNSDIDSIIWANASGAELFGGRGVVDLLAMEISNSQIIVQQIKKSIEEMEPVKKQVREFALQNGLHPINITLEVKRIKLADDDYGYKIRHLTNQKNNQDENTHAQNAVNTLAGFADAAAILDDNGLPLSVSQAFQSLGPSEDILLSLIAELKREKDRLIKRPQTNLSGNSIAIGLARISDKPGRNLIVLANTSVQPSKLDEQQEDLDQNEAIEAVLLSDGTYEETIDASQYLEADQTSEPNFKKEDGTIRFAWVIDENLIFQSVSPELAETVGENAAEIIGRKWRDIANVFGFDTNYEIENLLNKHDTWSGKTVLWPVEGTNTVLPVDLAALPVFNSERDFGGFRGFGIIRSADAILDPDETGMALVSQQPEEIQPEENLEASFIPRDDEAEIEPAIELPSLTEEENTAFRKIGDTLREGEPEQVSPAEPEDVDTMDKVENIETINEEIAEHTPAEEPHINNIPVEEAHDKEAPTEEALNLTNNEISAFTPAGLDISIMENLPVAIVIYNSEEILFTNQTFLQTSGYRTTRDLEEAGGIEAILAPTSNDNTNEFEAVNYCLKTQSGEIIPINPVLHTVPWGGAKALLISFNTSDIEQSVEPPALEMSSISEIQNILDITSDGILVLEPTGNIISINSSAEALFNISFDEAKGQDITSLFATESKLSIRHYVESHSSPTLDKIFNDGQEVIATEANGGMIPAFITISKMRSSGKLCAVIRDMTNWKKAEEELIQSRHEAESASGNKTDFLANISHEIRTPLNSIIGFSEIMIEERFGPIKNDRYREYLRDINRSGNHVLELINDLLDLSKIESGKLELEFTAVDLNEVVSETVALLQPQANDNRIIIRTSLSRAVPKVVADARSIRQVILNLVSNAIKFSPINSQVIVSTVYENNGEVALRIRDTGNGMSETEITKAMQPFQQIQRTNKKQNKGTGLGLPLTKALVEANRALFDLESEVGQGTIAHVQFPTQRVLAD